MRELLLNIIEWFEVTIEQLKELDTKIKEW
jgi:hypothetical protein